MKHYTPTNAAQLGFDSLLAAADDENALRFFFKTVTHLPGTWDEAVAYYRTLLDQHHTAMVEAKENEVIRLRAEAHDLATKLNGGAYRGVCAPDGPGTRLDKETASVGHPPKWGQVGSFVIDHHGMAVRVEMEGMFGIGGAADYWPSFQVHAVNRRKPFITETGFRSFMGCGYQDLVAGLTPERFVCDVLTDYVDSYLSGKLVRVRPKQEA